ncbi:DUF4012 domain-containing protein [Arthrobacter sp. HS15c]|uniref:DUF4012 domain-containing protein n=1 Tax=Arthrobacter sp. HS15c TaxID=3230279 RepID=UPI0034652724
MISEELTTATMLIDPLKDAVSSNDPVTATSTVEKIKSHTAVAKEAASDPLWSLASSIPWVGPNFSAVAEVARSADDVANLGLAPLVKVYDSLDWNSLVPSSTGTNLDSLEQASPYVTSAAYAVRASGDRLDKINVDRLLPQVADPLTRARLQLQEVSGTLDAAANASQVLPVMLGANSPRNYLLMIQNNAEARASGGIPGALAVLNVDHGKLTLGAQSNAAEVGVMDPVIPLDPEQQHIYSSRMGKFMQDVNLTPDFPTAASTAQTMWERKTGQHVDGVVSIDPVVLSYVLDATGPVTISSPELLAITGAGLPTELNGNNVVQTLLSDVYAKVEQPKLQDAYFASVAQEIFAALSGGKGEAKGILDGLTRGVQEGRVLIWSGLSDEQSVIAKYPVSGSVTGASVSPAQFSVYFNDGTGAKMDFYVKRTVQLIRECPKDGYEQTIVRVTSTNTAPSDAADSLPAYVTGAGIFGVPAGSVQTNIVAYGPAQANIESATLDGKKTEFAPYLHGNRPVGVLATRLAPGESRTIEFTFGKIVQHTEPDLFVTPTVQDVKDVMLPTQNLPCGQ